MLFIDIQSLLTLLFSFRAEVDCNEAVKQVALYEYGQPFPISFQEVEDALIQENRQNKSTRSLEEQIELPRQTTQQLRIDLSDYLDLLTALDHEQRLQGDPLSANLLLIEYSLALYRALAGSFETPKETMNSIVWN